MSSCVGVCFVMTWLGFLVGVAVMSGPTRVPAERWFVCLPGDGAIELPNAQIGARRFGNVIRECQAYLETP